MYGAPFLRRQPLHRLFDIRSPHFVQRLFLRFGVLAGHLLEVWFGELFPNGRLSRLLRGKGVHVLQPEELVVGNACRHGDLRV